MDPEVDDRTGCKMYLVYYLYPKESDRHCTRYYVTRTQPSIFGNPDIKDPAIRRYNTFNDAQDAMFEAAQQLSNTHIGVGIHHMYPTIMIGQVVKCSK